MKYIYKYFIKGGAPQGMYAPDSEQKLSPWQQPKQQQSPSPLPHGQTQGRPGQFQGQQAPGKVIDVL